MRLSKARIRSALRLWNRSRIALAAAAVLSSGLAQAQDHVGQPVPEYVHGDECLFCHREDIGSGWQKNVHGITIRHREDASELVRKLSPPAEVEFLLGSRRHVRFLKKSGYGKFAIQNPGGGWDNNKAADRCAGCHTTGVDPKTRAFSAFGLDCYTCHGVVDLEHTADTAKMWLSKKWDDVKAITSICAQCHLREA